MKRTVLIMTAALMFGGLASAQSIRPNAPDSIVVDLGVATAPQFTLNQRPELHLYGNVSVQERLLALSGGNLIGTVTLGNSYNDYSRLYVEGKLDYQVNNVTLYTALKQGFYSDSGFRNAGTSIRVGAQARF